MDKKEAIRRIRDHMKVHKIGKYPHIKLKEALDMAIESLMEKEIGKWIGEKDPNGDLYCIHCSICDPDFHRINIMTAFPYCPYCGNKMDTSKIY